MLSLFSNIFKSAPCSSTTAPFVYSATESHYKPLREDLYEGILFSNKDKKNWSVIIESMMLQVNEESIAQLIIKHCYLGNPDLLCISDNVPNTIYNVANRCCYQNIVDGINHARERIRNCYKQ